MRSPARLDGCVLDQEVEHVAAGQGAHEQERATVDNVWSLVLFFFSSRRRHTRSLCDWSSDVCSSDLEIPQRAAGALPRAGLAQYSVGGGEIARVYEIGEQRAKQLFAAAAYRLAERTVGGGKPPRLVDGENGVRG